MVKRNLPVLVSLAMIVMLMGTLFLPLVHSSGSSTTPPTIRASHDLTVDKIDVLPNIVGDKKYYPGMTVVIYVDVMNEGSLSVPPSESYEVVLVVDDMLDNVTTLSARSFGLPAGMNRTIIFQIKLPEHPTYDLPHSYNLVATVNYALDEDLSNNQLLYPAAITVYSPTIFKPRIEVPPEYQHINVVLKGGTYATPVKIEKIIIKNEANVQDAITIEYVSVPEGWDVPQPKDIWSIQPKGNVTWDGLVIIIPSDLKYAQNEVDYVLKLRPYSLFYPQGDYPTAEIHFSIDFVPGARITPYEAEKYVSPGRRETVRFNVTNTGNGPDIFDFAIVPDPNAVRYGWKLDLQTRTLYNPLAPGESADVVVMVQCPTTVPQNSNIMLKIKAISQKAPEYESESTIGMRLYAGPYIAASFEKEEYLLYLLPGQVNRFTINVTNEGNGRDNLLRVHAEGAPPGWAISIDQSPLFAGVGPRTTVPLQISIYVPPTSRSGYNYFELVITGGANGVTLATAEVTAHVKPSYGVLLTADEVVKKGFVGSEVTFALTVKNMGNIEDTFDIYEEHPEDWEVELEFNRIIDLSNNFTFDLYYRVIVPPGTAADADRSTPGQDPYPIKIVVVSENDTTVSHTLTLFVEVQPYYHFRFFLKDPLPILFNADDPDAFMLLNVYVENLGNFMESIRFDLVDNFYSWVQLKTLYTAIGYVQTGKAILQLAPPPGMEPGYYNITLRGTVKENPDVVREIPIPLYFYRLDFRVNRIMINDDPYDPDSPPEVSVNHLYAIRVNITNEGTMDYTIARMPPLYVGLYISGIVIGRKNVTYVPRGGYAEVVFRWSPQLTGVNQLLIKVDDVGGVPEYNENNNTYTLSLEAPPPQKEEGEKTKSYAAYYAISFLLLVFFLAGFVYFYRKANSIIISPYELGYDETGAYNPAAARAAFEGGERDVTRTAAEGIGPRSPFAQLLPEEKPSPALSKGAPAKRGALPSAAPPQPAAAGGAGAPVTKAPGPAPARVSPPTPAIAGAAARAAPQRPLQARAAPLSQVQRLAAKPAAPTPQPRPAVTRPAQRPPVPLARPPLKPQPPRPVAPRPVTQPMTPRPAAQPRGVTPPAGVQRAAPAPGAPRPTAKPATPQAPQPKTPTPPKASAPSPPVAPVKPAHSITPTPTPPQVKTPTKPPVPTAPQKPEASQAPPKAEAPPESAATATELPKKTSEVQPEKPSGAPPSPPPPPPAPPAAEKKEPSEVKEKPSEKKGTEESKEG